MRRASRAALIQIINPEGCVDALGADIVEREQRQGGKPVLAHIIPGDLRQAGDSIVKATLSDFEVLRVTFAFDTIDEAVIPGDPPRPPAFQVALERLRLPLALGGGATTLFNELVQPFQ